MMTNLSVFTLLFLGRYTLAFTSYKSSHQHAIQSEIKDDRIYETRRNSRRACSLMKRSPLSMDDELPDSCTNPCDKFLAENNDMDMDRRETAFALMGTLWAVAGNALIPTTMLFPEPAIAEYGADANMVIPNPYEALNDRATKQCLVESLGTRQCLVYADEANFLYKGADDGVLLERLRKAASALGTVPALVESKKWTQVTGVLTGPMGELIRNMGQLADLSANADDAKALIKTVKIDLYAISEGVSRKDQGMVLKSHEKATKDLVAFLKSL